MRAHLCNVPSDLLFSEYFQKLVYWQQAALYLNSYSMAQRFGLAQVVTMVTR
jgi:hypothetical protein